MEGVGLASAVVTWATSTASMDKKARGNPYKNSMDTIKRGFSLSLPEQVAVRSWPTPCASASKGSSQASLIRKSGASRENDRLDHAVMASDNGQLNPNWVEWLMGWPIGLTELKPLVTVKFQGWLQQHGEF